MRYIFLVTLFLFSLQLTYAQDKPDGPYKDFYDSGELMVEGQYKNQEPEGEWKRYYKNGQVSLFFSYANGKQNEEEISYYKDGIVSSEVTKVGEDYIRFGYYESGKLKYERKEDAGYYKSFYEDGQLEVEANYIDNELSGKWKFYNESGNLEWIVSYEDGYRHGIYQQFYKNGKLKVEGLILREKKEGSELRYDENETLVWKGYYDNDEFAKTWIRHDENGKKVEKIRIKGDPTVLNLKKTKVPDGVLEKVPVFPGCEVVFGNKARKKCMSDAVSMFIAKKFNKDLALDLDLEGRQRIILFFKIDKEGFVTDAKAKAPHPKLSDEAVRVINQLPHVKPAYQSGKPVIIPFSIPIVFQVQ